MYIYYTTTALIYITYIYKHIDEQTHRQIISRNIKYIPSCTRNLCKKE